MAHAVIFRKLLFHTHEPLRLCRQSEETLAHMSLCFCFTEPPVPPAVLKSGSIQTTKGPKHQERASVKAFCSFSTQGMNSKGNLGMRGEDSPWGQPALAKQPGQVWGIHTDVLYVCLGREKNLVERAAAASCSGTLCQMPWHCGYGLFHEVHPIQEWRIIFYFSFQRYIRFPI